ncbi:MAG: DUF1707 SHOCT-like domain-containing protein [Thermoleophilaceae bacterium]
MTALLVSDREREYTVGLLRGHWLSGRLTADEFEQRVEEAWRARDAEDLWRTGAPSCPGVATQHQTRTVPADERTSWSYLASASRERPARSQSS